MDAIERGFRFGGAIVVASLAAGPIFCFSAALTSLPSSPGIAAWSGLLWFAIVTIPYGAMFAFLPNLVGTASMTILGAWFPWARSWLAWSGAGGVGGALWAIPYSGAVPSDVQLLAIMVLAGIACAAICRSFTRWPDLTHAPHA